MGTRVNRDVHPPAEQRRKSFVAHHRVFLQGAMMLLVGLGLDTRGKLGPKIPADERFAFSLPNLLGLLVDVSEVERRIDGVERVADALQDLDRARVRLDRKSV